MGGHARYLLCFLCLVVLLRVRSFTEQESGSHDGEQKGVDLMESSVVIGAVVDCGTRIGMEEIVAMEMAVGDLEKLNGQRLIPRTKCSRGDPVLAAQMVRFLVNKIHAQAIIGLNSWEESYAVAKLAEREQFNVSILSLSDSVPPWAASRWPFFIQASPSTAKQMAAVAAITQSSGWRRINVVYEDSASSSDEILSHLYGALQKADVQISSLLALPSFASFDTVRELLKKLQKGQCRVFLVHANSALAIRLFNLAQKMRMMESGYVWITTDPITSLVHSLNASVISSMQGVVGVRRFFSEATPEYHDFSLRFVDAFRKKYPLEKNHEPDIFALQAYDVVWALGYAMNSGSGNGLAVIEKIQETSFLGLSGVIEFKGKRPVPISQFQIINVIGKSYREVGYWSEGLGFSTASDNTTAASSQSMEIFGQLFWPGGPWSAPRGWDLPSDSNPMMIGVPNGSLTNKFVKVDYDPATNSYLYSGFSLEVFNKTVQHLKFSLPYKFIAFDGSYTDLVRQVQLKKFDAAVGDIAVVSSRYDYVEFTHAHTASGLVMVVPVQFHASPTWLFLKPFTTPMWLLTAFINVYNGFVVWSIERNYCSKLRGKPVLHQIGTLIWLAFATLFSLHGEKLHSNLSRMATVVWLFVALIITQSYTASLSSMLTVQHLEPKITNIEILKIQNSFIGCSRRSFVKGYLETALHFNPDNIKNFTTTEEYAQALRNGDIAAAFLEYSVAKLFVAKYCKSFAIAGPSYKVGGYGFAFPKGSQLLPDIDEALLKVFESGELKDLENNLIASEKCIDTQYDNKPGSLSPQSFFVLFILTGGTSTTMLIVYYCQRKRKNDDSMAQHIMIWMLIFRLYKEQRMKYSRKVSDVESSKSPNTTPSWE